MKKTALLLAFPFFLASCRSIDVVREVPTYKNRFIDVTEKIDCGWGCKGWKGLSGNKKYYTGSTADINLTDYDLSGTAGEAVSDACKEVSMPFESFNQNVERGEFTVISSTPWSSDKVKYYIKEWDPNKKYKGLTYFFGESEGACFGKRYLIKEVTGTEFQVVEQKNVPFWDRRKRIELLPSKMIQERNSRD